MVSSASPSPNFTSAVSDTKQQHATTTASEKVDQKYAHAATPLHGHGAGGKKTPRRGRSEGGAADTAGYVAAVSCSDCRFKQRAIASASPGAVIRSLFVSLARCSTPRYLSLGLRGRRRRRAVAPGAGRRGGGDGAAAALAGGAGAEAGAARGARAAHSRRGRRLPRRRLPPRRLHGARHGAEPHARALNPPSQRRQPGAQPRELPQPGLPRRLRARHRRRRAHRGPGGPVRGQPGGLPRRRGAHLGGGARARHQALQRGAQPLLRRQDERGGVVAGVGARAALAGAAAAGLLPGRQGRVGGAPPRALRAPAAPRRARRPRRALRLAVHGGRRGGPRRAAGAGERQDDGGAGLPRVRRRRRRGQVQGRVLLQQRPHRQPQGWREQRQWRCGAGERL